MSRRLAVMGSAAILSALAAQGAAQSPGTAHVCFVAADGYWIHAEFYPPKTDQPAPMVMLLHDWDGDRSGWTPLVPSLRSAGFAVLALDLRGHGQSADSATREQARRGDPALAEAMLQDLRGAYDWLAARPQVDRARFALVGAGAGADLALRYAVADRSVDAVLCLSPLRSGYGLDPYGDLGQIHGRTVVLVGGADEQAECRSLADRASGAEVRIAERAARGVALLTEDPALRRWIVQRLLRGVGPASAHPVCGSINSHIFHTLDSGWVTEIHPSNLRFYSSAAEARARGLRPARSKGPRGHGPTRGAAAPRTSGP